MRLIITSDWELTTSRLPVAREILEELSTNFGKSETHLVIPGDVFREFNAATVSFAREMINLMDPCGWFVVGNHDREIGTDRLTAIMNPGTVFSDPRAFKYRDRWFAFLPAPDRAAFGVARGAEGKRARDAALSQALEAALISLETQIGAENLGRAVLFAHAATDGEELGLGQLASGLTWTIPGARLQRWGRVFLGHVHKPAQIAENVWSVGGIAPWQFSDKAEQFRALTLDTETFEVGEIPLKRVLVPIEMELTDPSSNHPSYVTVWAMSMMEERGIKLATDTVSLKIRARLPQNEMALVPSADELRDAINALVERPLIQNCIITREVTGLHKARLTTEQSAREMTLEQMLELYIASTENGHAPALIDQAKQLLRTIESYYTPGEGTFGFEPLTLGVNNFRQWRDARIDFTTLEGAVALWGPNETGKTNLLEAIAFALFKRSPSSTSSIEDELRLGETAGNVVFRFRARGETLEVRRALERGRGGVTCKSELLRVDLEPAEAVCEMAADIDKRIIELVGSYEFFLSTVFRAQRDLHRLIEATPAQWNKLIHEALNLDCLEPVRKIASNEAENAALRARETYTRQETLEEQASAYRMERDGIDADDIRRRMAELAERITRDEFVKASLEQEREAMLEHRSSIREQINGRAKLETQLLAAERALASIKPQDLGARPEPIALSEGATEERLVHLRGDLEAIDTLIGDHRAQTSRSQAELAGLERSIESLARAQKETQRRLEEWQAAKDKLPQASCDSLPYNSPIGVIQNDPGVKASCWFFQQAANPEAGKRLMEELESYGAKFAEKQAEHKALSDDLSTGAGTITEATARRSTIAAMLASVSAELDAARTRNAEISAYDLRVKAQEQLVAQKGAREEEIETLKQQIALVPDAAAELSDILKEIERAENRISAQVSLIKAAQASVAELESKLGKLEMLAEQIKKLERQAAEAAEAGRIHTGQQLAWTLIATAFHHTGIPYLLMERVIGGFEQIANELLDGTGMTIAAETVTPTKKGEARDKLSIRFTDARGQHALSQASGEQGTLLSIVLSAALSITGSQFWGATPELYVQDEGWGTLDAEHLEIARELIARIAARFTRFVYITHVAALAESADAQLRVEAEGGVSRLVA